MAQQPSGNHVADEPGRLRPAAAINVHRLPEFDQDSWTVNAPPGAEKTRESTQPLDLPNNNNNSNNNTLAPGEAALGLDSCPAGLGPPLRAAEGAGAAPSRLGGTSDQAVTADGAAAVTLATDGWAELLSEAGEQAMDSGDVDL